MSGYGKGSVMEDNVLKAISIFNLELENSIKSRHRDHLNSCPYSQSIVQKPKGLPLEIWQFYFKTPKFWQVT
ncbi:Major facilitator superfamily domain-containing protein 12 [Manis javanica]|nr:Major facilitator superfamily domain-containing protein 12 [Manis javanica]